MERLSYATLKRQGFDGYLLEQAPERVLQFGEGNFLRAFVDYFIDRMNEEAGFDAKVCVVQPIPYDGRARFAEQECLYTLFLRGQENGEKVNKKRVISAINRCINAYLDYDVLMDCAKNPDLRFIVSNTTEAGIVYDPSCEFTDKPANSFPGKLTQFLYHRFELGLPGFIILSCELIDHNGEELNRCVHAYIKQWGLSDTFAAWVDAENVFCSTLVDRIVPGYPRSEAATICEELGYEDQLIDTGEVFGAWVIQGPQSIKEEFPFEKAGLPILVVDDVTPYKQRKVRILNGAHTSFVLGAYLAGQNIVRDCMKDPVIQGFMNKTLYEEVIPTLDLPKEDLLDFAAAVAERFANPYIDHQLLSISLNSTSKWRARCMPSLLEYARRNDGALAPCLTFSFAAYMDFYRSGKERTEKALVGKRGEDTFEISDDAWVLDFYYEHKDDTNAEIANAVIANEAMWGEELKNLPGFTEAVIKALDRIDEVGIYEAMREVQG
ncbi:MAG: tagaturonate reductase [Lachnospiraceae bacterium]|nr:tagaturonate reductase [Lachnospiraceae bacterium]